MGKRKRLTALLCAVVMALTLLPVQAWATGRGEQPFPSRPLRWSWMTAPRHCMTMPGTRLNSYRRQTRILTMLP